MEPVNGEAARIDAPVANRILEVSLSLAESLDFDTVLGHAVDGAVSLLGADTGAVYLLDGADLVLGATVPVVDLRALPPEAVRSSLYLSPQARLAIESCQPHAISTEDSDELSPHERTMMELRGFSSLLYVPVVNGGVALGVMMLGSQSSAHRFGPGDTYVARALSAEVALAITNARLFRDSERVAQEMAEVAGFSEAVFDASPTGIIVVSESGMMALANEAVAGIFGTTREHLLATNVYDLPNWHSIGLIALIEQVIADRTPATFEYNGLSSWGRDICVEARLSPLRRAGEPQVVMMINDTSVRKASERALMRRAEFDGIFSDILVELAACDAEHIDEAVNAALERVARFLGADGAFVFTIHDDGLSGSINHCWRAEGGVESFAAIQDVPLDALASIATTLFQNEPVVVSSIEDFPEDALADRALHRLLGAESALEVPMRGRHGAVVGAVGLTSSRQSVGWGEEEQRLARMLGSAIANSFERQAAERAQRATANDWIQTFEAAGDGIAVVELGARIRRLNDSMARRFGRGVEECEGEYCSMLRGCAEELTGTCPHHTAVEAGLPQSSELFDMSTGKTYLVTASPLRGGENGEVTGTVCISHDITEIKEYDARMRQLADEVSVGQLATIFALAKLAESRDDSTGRHIECVQELCRVIAYEMQDMDGVTPPIDEPFISRLTAAAPLHDVGKVGVPDSILLKPGPLTPDEFEVVKTHAVIGANTLSAVQAQHPNNEFVSMGVDIARYHHERWDGEGYPDGLSGEEIPLAARIMAVADVYEALRSERVYKAAYTHEESVEIIREEIGTKFDPRVGEAFLSGERKLEHAWNALRG